MRRLQIWFAVLYLKYGYRRFNNIMILVSEDVTVDLDHWNSLPGHSRSPLGTQRSRSLWMCFSRVGELLWATGQRADVGRRATLPKRWRPRLWLTIRHFVQVLMGRHILVVSDSMTAKACINRQGGLSSELCRLWAGRLATGPQPCALDRALHVPRRARKPQTYSREGVCMRTIGTSFQA